MTGRCNAPCADFAGTYHGFYSRKHDSIYSNSAGLLTYSTFAVFPSHRRWDSDFIDKCFQELTAAGTVPDFLFVATQGTGFPFHSELTETENVANIFNRTNESSFCSVPKKFSKSLVKLAT
jgi:hypothetical protein